MASPEPSNTRGAIAVLGVLVVAGAPLAAHVAASHGAGPWPMALLATGQAAVLAGALARIARPGLHNSAAVMAGAAALFVALLACRASPQIGTAAVTSLSHAAIYGSLLLLFARSLRPGHDAIATRLARRIHAPLTARRVTYTRRVTWVWAGYFACQLAVSAPLAIWPGAPGAWMIRASDLPLAALLMAGELAVRAWIFRGQPHASAADMVHAFRRSSLLGAPTTEDGPPP